MSLFSAAMRLALGPLLFLWIPPCFCFGQQEAIAVYRAGTEGHATYRIPAIVCLPVGHLLAFAEGRVNGGADFGDINLVMKRSQDGGKSWTPLRILVDRNDFQAGNPAPVVDRFDPDFPEGVLYLFYNTGDHHEHEVRQGNGLREVWFIRSTDAGETWSAPVNITTQVHRPNRGAYTFPEDWRSYANTPGHGFQFMEGKYKGRLYIPANHSRGAPRNEFRDYQSHGFFSDDHGKTFQLSNAVGLDGSNEAMGAELSRDRMLLSIRNQAGDIRNRLFAFSSDGGMQWDTVFFNLDLPDPVCQGSIIGLGKRKGQMVLAFCNPADPIRRDKLTLRISTDEGQTWSFSELLDAAAPGYKGDWTAYSDLALLEAGKLAILYERDNYREIVFRIVQTGKYR